MSFWSALGGDAKKLWGFVTSAKGQAVIQTVETGVEVAFPAAAGVINLLNLWGGEVMKIQGISEVAAATPGADTNAAKAAAVLSVVTPEVTAFLAQYKLPAMTMSDINIVNTKIVDILNLLTGVTSTSTATTPTVPVTATTPTVNGDVQVTTGK